MRDNGRDKRAYEKGHIMKNKWPIIRLGSVLTQVARAERVLPEKEYGLLGVRLDNRGPFLRETVAGTNTSARTLFKVHENDFIYSRLFAWRGSFGIIGKALDGCYVSNEFPIYSPDQYKIDSKFLLYWITCPAILRDIESKCSGSTPLTRNRFKEHFFEEMLVPLPTLPEQRRIVARIDEISKKLNEGNNLLEIAKKESLFLMRSVLFYVFERKFAKTMLLPDVAPESGKKANSLERQESIYLSLEDIEAHTGRILTPKTASGAGIIGAAVEFNNKHVLFSKLRPYLNKVAVPDFDGIGTTELVVLKPNTEILERKFLSWYLRSPQVVEKLIISSSGTKMPRANMAEFRALQVPIPEINEQIKIVNKLEMAQAKLSMINFLRNKLLSQYNSLMPSILDKAFKGEL